MKRKYDSKILKHYRAVAEEYGLSSTSTMADCVTRDMETDAIAQFVGEVLRHRQVRRGGKEVTIMDVGCGNGYTLDVLLKKFPNAKYFGIEKSAELRLLALSRFHGRENVRILRGDIRNKNFAKNITADILICQRVLINLLSEKDQKSALSNIIDSVKPPSSMESGGSLLFIESFIDSWTRLNEARGEFDLEPINQADHNQYLKDEFFDTPRLKPFQTDGWSIRSNLLSTHYYVTRVLHPILTRNQVFKRNSEFVKFFTGALNNAGDYSPLKIYAFEKAGV